MRSFSRNAAAALVAVAVVGALAAGATAKPTKTSGKIKACALLPETKASTRYTLFDAPYLKKAFKKANIPASVVKGNNDPQKQTAQAEQCLDPASQVLL